VLTAQLVLGNGGGGVATGGGLATGGTITFERSPARMAVTGSIAVQPIKPGRFDVTPHQFYLGVLIDAVPAKLNAANQLVPAVMPYAARGYRTSNAATTVDLEVLPGNGLFSLTPNALPVNPLLVSTDYPLFTGPPSAAVLAAFEAVHAGSALQIVDVSSVFDPTLNAVVPGSFAASALSPSLTGTLR
jgi:hypothetical protein